MSEPVASATSSLNDTTVPAPWWIRLCRWLWKISAFLGVSVVLSLVVSVFATWLTSPVIMPIRGRLWCVPVGPNTRRPPGNTVSASRVLW